MITADSLVSEVLAEPDPCELDKKLSTAGVRGALVDLQKPFTATAAPGLPSAEDASGGSTPAPQGNDGSLADPLDALSPSEHSLGYLHFLHARVATVQIPMTNDPYPLLRRIATFLCSFDPRQVRVAPRKMVELCKDFSHLCHMAGAALFGIKPLVAALRAFAPSPAHITGLHTVVIKHILAAKMYRQAISILRHRITEIEPDSLHVNVTDYLQYHYYAGMVNIGLKKFRDAASMFIAVLFCPSITVSAIQVEAYKKFVLTSLLLYGKVSRLPKYCAQIVVRTVEALCQGYTQFAVAFETMNVEKTRAALEKLRDVFTEDENYGLAKQALRALHRHKISQLTQTYLTLSISDIARVSGITGLDAAARAETEIIGMIESGAIHATISQNQGINMPTDSSTAMVSFHDGPLRYFTAESVESLAGSLRSASTVSETLFRTERALATSKAYIARQVRPGHRHRPAPHPHEWASGGGISRFSRGFGPSNSASTRLSRGRHAAGASSLPAFDNEGLGSPSSSASSLATAAAAAMEAQLGVETDPAELAHTATGGYEYIQDENMDDGDMEMAEYSDEGSYPESS